MKKRPEYWIIAIVFFFKLFDSLYVNQHGDALGYHLYAPLNWARFGWDSVSLYQLIQWQGSLFESLVTVIFKLAYPVTEAAKTNFLIFFQILSCAVGYLLVPIYLCRQLRKDKFLPKIGLLAIFYGSEFLTFTWGYAKNDSFACLCFLIFALSKNRLHRTLAAAAAIAFKSTYLYAIVIWAVVECIISEEKSLKAMRQKLQIPFLAIAFGLGPFILRNYLVTGNPVFPFPSTMGLQPSGYLGKYFLAYMGKSDLAEALHKIALLTVHSPIIVFLFFMMFLNSALKKRWDETFYFWSAVVFYLFMTGPALEWRTVSGVLLACAFKTYEHLDFTSFKKPAFVLMLLLGIFTSKIDPSSVVRWNEASGKAWWELTANGAVFNDLNEKLGVGDVVLTQHFTEGYFLVPQLYQISHHPAREEILKKYPLFESESKFLAVKTTGDCFQKGYNLALTQALLQKSMDDVELDSENKQIFWIHLDCSPTS